MAGIEDALKFLDPKYIDKAKELLSDPMGSGAGIMNAIKDFDPIEAANFVKDKVLETTFGEANVDDMIIGGGVGGQPTEFPGIFSETGDYILDQAGIPVNMSTLSDIGSAFTDQGTEGVVEVAKNQAINLIKNGLVNEGIALASKAGISGPVILALANNPYTGPYIRGAGSDLADMGYDLASSFPFFGNQLGTVYDTGLNLFGINRERDKKPDPPTNQLTGDQINQIIEDEIDFRESQPPPPIVVTDTQKPYESGVGQDTGQTGGPGGMGFAPPPSPTSGNVGTSGMTWQNVIDRANGGLVSISKYLKGR